MDDRVIESMSRTAHEVIRAWSRSQGEDPRVAWEDLPEQARVGTRERVKTLVGDPGAAGDGVENMFFLAVIRGMMGAMTFGQALEQLAEGRRVSRRGWEDRRVWLTLVPGSITSVAETRKGAVLQVNRSGIPETRRVIRTEARIDLESEDGSRVVGWLASQADMLADDWEIHERG